MKARTLTLILLCGVLISLSQAPNTYKLWYEHDPLEATVLDATNWTLFDGGCGAGQGVDAYSGPINLPFDFCFYNTSFDVVYLNTKGVLTFIEPMCDWTPDQFPGQSAFNMISGFWAGFDFTSGGICYYEVQDNYAVFTFENVGYSNGMGNLRNTFQMIITDGTSDLLPAGNNVGFFYQDMEWAHSNIGGSNGFNGPNPAVVGVDKAAGTDHVQFGTFNYNSNIYNGQYEESGVQWLENKNFIFSTCGTENKPPVSNFNYSQLEGELSSLAEETIQICIGDTLELSADYFGPEQGETITLSIDDSNAENFTLLSQMDGEVASWTGTFVGAEEFIGIHELTVTASDNGVPVGVTTQTIVVEVIDTETPVMEIVGESAFCPGAPAELTAFPGNLDYYSWSNGCQGTSPECDVYAVGWITVTGYNGACVGQASTFISSQPFNDCILSFDPSSPICNGDTVSVTMLNGDQLQFIEWSCFDDANPDFDCNIYTDSINETMFYCGPGTYSVDVITQDNCPGNFNFQIADYFDVPTQNTPELICGTLDSYEFEGGYSVVGEGYLVIYFQDADGNYANGSWLNVTINGETNQFAMTESSFSLSNNDFAIQYGDEICIEYIPSPDDDGNNTITLFNCGNSNNALCGALVGYSNTPIEYELCDTTYNGQILEWCGIATCEGELLYGEWTQESNSSDGFFSNTEEYNSVFTPLENGVYDLTFIADEYGCMYEYQLIYDNATTFEYFGQSIICDTSQIIILNGGNPLDGSYTGNGVSGNTFNPGIAGVGTHDICYTFPQLYCDSTICVQIQVETCTGIEDFQTSPFTIYPNPTSGNISIESPYESGEIYVFDTVGKLVFTESLSRKIVIDGSSWSEGMYFLNIHTSDEIFRERIEVIK